MSHTEMDRETCEVEYGLEQTDLETCPKSVWSTERRERLGSPIGDRLRVTRAGEIRNRLTQAERTRKSVTKKPLRTGSVTQDREHVLNGKGSDSDGSRRGDRVEPTPTREQTALGRRSPQ